ncbi:DUF2309 domain-containing protein [Rubinisphaera margarita]|uniref:DUF2309 domain-containing protein n=1 Tax=Rubinisphaera margarita TaxID=2909586 RepID=UPI001EE903D4|nr:DUF2309 domain-containing protein [Rubinisphaera margarita]MCG6156469.1 DUF2309 domain-containing protein [Rubinisphaera margarita]
MSETHAQVFPLKDERSSDSRQETHEQLRQAFEHAVHYLPTQGPISVFVHHNTLHPLEDLPFAEAVRKGYEVYGGEPYLSEHRYRDELRSGRILLDDLRQILMDDLGDRADDLVASFGTRYMVRFAMLRMTLHSATDAELRWLLAESDLLKSFHEEVSPQRREQIVALTCDWISQRDISELPAVVRTLLSEYRSNDPGSWHSTEQEAFALKLLWRVCHQGVHAADPTKRDRQSCSYREKIFSVAGQAAESRVNDLLIRFCSVYLDRGLASWSLPDRQKGFAFAFAQLLSRRVPIRRSWTRMLREDLEPLLKGDFDPLESIATSLSALGVELEETERFILQTLLSMRGWAGMIWQLESHAPWSSQSPPPGTLLEFLAVRLLLERHSIACALRGRSGVGDLADLAAHVHRNGSRSQTHRIDQRAYAVFQLAQVCGWTFDQLLQMSQRQWKCLIEELDEFSSLERRRILQLGYERRYAHRALDAIAVHSRRRRELNHPTDRSPAFHAVFCIDDREESFRRHLEEVDPECRTSSAAGFFAVAMYYRGAEQAHYRPLCPNVIQPQHYVREEPLFSTIDASRRRAGRRRTLGMLAHHVNSGSRTLVGGWITGILGAVHAVPMVARIMAPLLTSQIRESMNTWVKTPATELHLERTDGEPGKSPEALGYSLNEMASIVVRVLEDLGMVENLSQIVFFCGHGSSSLNNPHESAYNCGACSGGRGGPNARAFAMMANDPRARRLVAERGIAIPDDVYFLGGYHNTCNDRVEYYDLDRLPRSHRALFRRMETSLNEARARNAHERARRFESAPADLTPREALEHVEQRAEDLSQARPEYNHATNALVIVGRREWSRGLFLDRRAFLTSYDPSIDDEQASILSRILAAAIPVCAGISLEYYFSTVDVERYGCGSKLPHNVASMLGVMTGAASDLRPGLSQQMVEIHEPMRILFVIETTPQSMLSIIENNPVIARLVKGEWVHLAVLDAETSEIQKYEKGRFEPYLPQEKELPEVASSIDWYFNRRDHLGFASVTESTPSVRPHLSTYSVTAGGDA